MMRSFDVLAFATLALVAACGSNGGGTTTAGSGGSTSSGNAGGSASTTGSSGGASTTGTTTASSGTGGGASSSTGTGTGGPPTAAELLALVAGCNQVSAGKYQTDDDASLPSNIPICGLQGAVFWKADMDVDCDGKQTAQCNPNTDPAYQNQTSATDSNGDPLDAASLPFVVVPLPSNRWSYDAGGLKLGSVVAVIYNGKLNYGVFGDEGPNNIIGEASYAMAKSLGIDPDPSTGGTDSGVTYIAFTGDSGVVNTIEDHAEAVTLGQMLATKLLADN